MKFVCLQDHLKYGISTVSHAVATKSPLPVLSHLLIATDQGRLKLAATNLEIGITCWIDAQIEEEGAVTIPARLLNDVIGGLPNDQVTITLNDQTQSIEIRCAQFITNIKGMEANEFPPIPTVNEQTATVSLPPDILRHAIEQVAFAAANDDTRPVLTGVLIRLQGEKLIFAAADGFRLATREVALPADALPDNDSMQEFLVPARALTEMARILANMPGSEENRVSMTVTSTGGQILFHTATVDLISRLIEGKFPDFERIMPKEHQTRAVLDTKALSNAVKLASHFAAHSQHIVKLTMQPGSELEPGKLIISANAAEVGDNTGELDGMIAGVEGQIAMNVRYLSEALNAIKTPEVVIESQTAQNPGVFRPVGQEEYVHIIMPMTIR
ncbi:MAG: DNA polymerase III subunit beta [Chloroflexaceae bacterium]|nr:DNA polymerase III subunit beta [Chloroflexaceae bacterium]